jgi:hypothetical protein
LKIYLFKKKIENKKGKTIMILQLLCVCKSERLAAITKNYKCSNYRQLFFFFCLSRYLSKKKIPKSNQARFFRGASAATFRNMQVPVAGQKKRNTERRPETEDLKKDPLWRYGSIEDAYPVAELNAVFWRLMVVELEVADLNKFH